MKSYKTTLAGLVAGLPILGNALLSAYNSGTFTGETTTQVILSIGVIAMGLLAKDFDQSGTDPVK